MLKDWNLYHKAVLAILLAIAFSAALRAYQAIDGGAIRSGFELDVEQPASAVWPWVTVSENRIRWEAHLLDMSRLQGGDLEEGATRFLFWRDDRKKRWTILEGTSEVIPQRKIVFRRESDFAARTMTIELEATSACRTHITVTEVHLPAFYGRRFWAFLEKGRYNERMAQSEKALQRWLETLPDAGSCS